MNYRAWYHHCWLVSYMSEEQVLQEFTKSREWAGLYVADNSCFHYRALLMLRLFEESQHSQHQDASFDPKLYGLLKDEFNLVEKLIKRYVGREKNIRTVDIDMLIDDELELFHSCTTLPDSDFESSSSNLRCYLYGVAQKAIIWGSGDRYSKGGNKPTEITPE